MIVQRARSDLAEPAEEPQGVVPQTACAVSSVAQRRGTLAIQGLTSIGAAVPDRIG